MGYDERPTGGKDPWGVPVCVGGIALIAVIVLGGGVALMAVSRRRTAVRNRRRA